jgi:hypothetical protein
MGRIVRARSVALTLAGAALFLALGAATATAHAPTTPLRTAHVTAHVTTSVAAGTSESAPSAVGENLWLWAALGVGIAGVGAGFAGTVLALGERREPTAPEPAVPNAAAPTDLRPIP